MRRCSRRKARSTGSRRFASENGPRFYGLPLNEGQVVLERAPVDGAGQPCGRRDDLVPFLAGETLPWRLVLTVTTLPDAISRLRNAGARVR